MIKGVNRLLVPKGAIAKSNLLAMAPFGTKSRLTPSNNKGAALLTVLIAMMIMTIMLFEFQYSSMVERKLAYNELNQLQAYYLAKSGARIGILRVVLYARAKKSPEIAAIRKSLPAIDSQLEAIWNLPLPPFPPPKSLVKALDGGERIEAEKQLKETKVTEGESTHVISSESSKINLNFLKVDPKELGRRINFTDAPKGVAQYVARILYQFIENFMAESEDPAEEYNNLRADELVMDIMDWVNPGGDRFWGGNKDAHYEGLTPPYKAKKANFFTVDELKMVKGVSGKVYQKLKPYVTVYSNDGKININGANSSVIKALYRDFTDDDMKRLGEEKARIGGTWPSVKTFTDFITNQLNRRGFSTAYNDPNTTPLTTDSASFLIESLGSIQRSGSSIQKTIKVAVAFVPPKGGSAIPNVNSKAECAKQSGATWYENPGGGGACRIWPKNQQECIDIGGGWTPSGSLFCCRVPGSSYTYDDCADRSKPASNPSTGGGTGTAATNPQQEAKSLKILYWNEG